MAKATRADDAIDGMLLASRRPRMSISASQDDPENPQAGHDEEVYVYQPEYQARRPSESVAEFARQPSGFETTSSGSLEERGHFVPYRVVNE